MVTLSLVCGLPKTSEEGRSPPVKKFKSSSSPPCTGTEKGQLCTTKETTHQGLPSVVLDLDYSCFDPLREQVSVQHLDSR